MLNESGHYKTMTLKLYMIPASSPVRAVQMTAKTLGLDLELVELNLAKKEHFTPEFLKLNPQHTVPTLVDDDGFAIWDSHAIMIYLISKYGKNDSLYPKDIKTRAIINQRLHFECGKLFARCMIILRPIVYQVKKTIDEADKNDIIECYGFLECFLNDKQWMAGNTTTIADYSLISSVSSIDVLIPVDAKKYPKLTAWMKRCEALPVYDVNKIGLDAFTSFVKSFMT